MHDHPVHMPLLNAGERIQAHGIASLAYGNPFLAERIGHERAVLGEAFVTAEPVWTLRPGREVHNINLVRVAEVAERLVATMRKRIAAGTGPSADEARLFEDIALYVLYDRYAERIWELLERDVTGQRVGLWDDFRRDAERLLDVPGVDLPARHDVARVFAEFFQVRRAFHYTFSSIVGG